MCIVVILYAIGVFCKNYAILLNSSRGFHNYRQMANVYIFDHILRQNGYEGDQIAIISYVNQIQDIRNVDKEHVHIDSDLKIQYSDFDVTDDALRVMLNALEGNHPKLKDADESSNVLIYMNGHGNESFLKFGSIHFMTKDDLMCRVVKLASRVGKVLLLVDTCQADALIDRDVLPSNVFAIATSKIKQSAISTFESSVLFTNTVDNFSYFFFMRAQRGIGRDDKLIDVFSDLSKEPIQSELVFSNNPMFNYGDFFFQNLMFELLPFK
ncbi:glycosylphosphatidylinositol transamidase [Ordospora colligata]|uniref:Glycosylphosphatidylinositol transamidase n=1 Tax=Ordospora colligata OC4 TaxID=1354746 RepID=A0A0B2UJA9_9MICR|nr:glycosylphosphatidylinositol transamidase [Ordospora colligata OC4]KHN69070.1 glycosylphosphatidylinositol transamidase [Ordospora colligata OC4]TBU14351.1 glycosylphosphatidylinositol transamidase [Ordospora colligata]TBU14416.1 glycosylphosphatidylinositol transamidase [Ordospora colligata]TBU17932.1 glycosylphosphatidylinositol transamidase [Ordospora colligata]